MIRAAIFEPENDLIVTRAIETLTMCLFKPFPSEDEKFEIVSSETIQKFIHFFMIPL